MNKKVDIDAFFHGASILITGGTGFLGKILVEKLLRTFNVKHIFLLIRNKNNMNPEKRLERFLEETIFDRLRNEQPKVFDKVIAIHADFDTNDLDISDENKLIIFREVSIVFNVVASVKFNEKLRDAFEINVLGTKKVIDLSMNMKNLKSFVHISTLYSNCNKRNIDERVYEQNLDYEKLIQISRILNDDDFEKLQHCLMEQMPNTYTMTKKCSENLVSHRAFVLPAGIFRPPIVLSTYKQPVPGWTDNLYGPTGLCTWTAKGLIHCIYGDKMKKANLVPADYCINAIIAAAWDINRRYSDRIKRFTEIPVYNYIYNDNNLTWGKYMQLARNGLNEPLEKSFWYFSYVILSSKFLYKFTSLVFHTIPGYALDTIALVFGHKQIYSKAYKKIEKVILMMSYFGLREWNIKNENIKHLSELLLNNNCNDLQFDMRTIDWNEYFSTYMYGIKKYFFKENLTDVRKLATERNNFKKLYMIHMCLKLFVWTLLSATSLKYVYKHILIKLILRF